MICCNISHGDWTRLYDITGMIKLRKVRWVVLIARAGEKRCVLRVLVEKPEQKDKWEDTSLHEKIILTRIFKKYDGGLRDSWRTLLYGNKIRFSSNSGNFLTS